MFYTTPKPKTKPTPPQLIGIYGSPMCRVWVLIDSNNHDTTQPVRFGIGDRQTPRYESEVTPDPSI